jgi:hypothetical protein
MYVMQSSRIEKEKLSIDFHLIRKIERTFGEKTKNNQKILPKYTNWL